MLPEETVAQNKNIFDYCAGAKAKGDWMFREVCYVQGETYERDLQKIVRYYVSNKGCKINKINKVDGREIQVQAGKWLLTEFNYYYKLPWIDYDVNTSYYTEAMYKEINNITGYSAAGATGTTSTNLVFSTSPSVTTPTLVGDATLSTGNIIQGTAAKGINFTANASQAGMTSQLLNWYETGTVTCGISFGGLTTGITYTVVACTYTRTGRQVHLEGLIYLSSKGSATGDARITGLPYAAAGYAAGSFEFQGVTSTGQRMGFVQGGSVIELRQITTVGTESTLTDTNFANNSIVIFAINYNA
jgi:hypothetical protein